MSTEPNTSLPCQFLSDQLDIVTKLLTQCPCSQCVTTRAKVKAILTIRTTLRHYLKYKTTNAIKSRRPDQLKSIDDKTTDYKFKKWMYYTTNRIIDHQAILNITGLI